MTIYFTREAITVGDDFAFSAVDTETSQNAVISKDHRKPRSLKDIPNLPDAAEWMGAYATEERQMFRQYSAIEPLASLPAGAHPLDLLLVWDIKRTFEGFLDKYKCRMCLRGDREVFGRDFDRVFSPTAGVDLVRFLVILAVQFSLNMVHLDVGNAFLSGNPLDKDVYCRFPPGMTVDGCKYGKVVRPVYGMHEAALRWYATSHEFLTSMGFARSTVEPCFYVLSRAPLFVGICVATDDYAIAHNDTAWYDEFLSAFSAKFTVTERGSLDLYLGVHYEWSDDRASVTLSQTQQIDDSLARFHMAEANIARTPMELGFDTSAVPRDNESPNFPYLSAIGDLLWTARCTHLEIQQAVIELSRYSANFTSYHIEGVKRVFRYLKGVKDFGLRFRRMQGTFLRDGIMVLSFHMYTDSDWARCKATRRSTGDMY